MKATRRRTRRPDPLASRAAVRQILAKLQTELGAASPTHEKDFVRLLRAAGHTARQPNVTSHRGRKSPWSDYEKSRVRLALADILAREAKSISPRSFIEHYLLILEFPTDVAEALETRQVNLFEAEQLARLSAKRLGGSAAQSKQRRQAFLQAHLQAAASGRRLKMKVDAALQPERQPEASATTLHQPEILAAAAALEAELSHYSGTPQDWQMDWSEGLPPEHLFGEYLNLIGSSLRELRPAELSETELERIAQLAEPLIQYLHQLHKQQNPPHHEEIDQTAQAFYI